MYLILVAKICLALSVAVLSLYATRHYFFASSRLLLKRPKEWMEFAGFTLPRTTVLVAMHNEQAVAGDVLRALTECDYDWQRLEIIAIDDRSTDRRNHRRVCRALSNYQGAPP
jgi:cellulose synthase/poly-beta-1,6-N-acetylglucosamine synthase-like glycosyltransferase